MKTLHRAMVVLVLTATMMYAAAPPGRWRALTKEEAKHVEALQARLNRHANEGEFEEAAKISEVIAAYRAERQSAWHWEAIIARYAIEEWSRLIKVGVKDRSDLILARRRHVEGINLLNEGREREAELLLRQALKIYQERLGENHPGTAKHYSNLAGCLQDQGKVEQSMPLFRKALLIRQKALGEKHPDTAASYNNVGYCFDRMGKATEALPYFQKALKISQQVLGEYHPRTASSSINVAECLVASGNNADALAHFQKALAIHRKIFGEGRPETATSYNYLAGCLYELGNSRAALPLFKKALLIRQDLLGEFHPDTATSCYNLAGCLQAQGMLEDSLPLHNKALKICRRIYGENHAETATCYNNLAGCLHAQGKLPEALPLFQKAQLINEMVLGEKHFQTAGSYNNVASCLQALGQFSDAMLLFQKSLEIRQHLFGKNHPAMAESYNNMASCLLDQGKPNEALEMFQKSLTVNLKMRGENHPSTAKTYNNIASCLRDQQKLTQALSLFQKAMLVNEKLHGPNHYDTAVSYGNVALNLYRLKKTKEAVTFFEKALLGFEYSRLNAGPSGFDRSQFQADITTPLGSLAALLARQKNMVNAWEMAESDVGRGLLDDFTEPDRYRGNEQKKLAEVESIQQRLLPLITLEKPTDAQRKLLSGLIEQRDKLQRELAEVAVRRARQRVATLAEVQKQLPSDTAIVFWLDIDSLKEHLGCIVRHKGEPQWVTLPGIGVKGEWRDEDDTLLARTLKALQNPITEADRLPGLLLQVRRQRLAPLEKLLKDIRHLIVLPTGEMSAFPVEVLTDRYTISYAPSATIYARQRRQHRAFEAKSALVLADPIFDREKAKEPTPPPHGLLVTSVLPKSLGLRIGLTAGDVLLEYDGKKLNKLDDLQYPKEEKQVAVTLWRNGRMLKGRIPGGNLGLTLDKRPVAEALKEWRQRQDKLMAFARGKDWMALPGTLVEARTLKTLIPDAHLMLGSDASETKLGELASSGKLKNYRVVHLATHGEANSKLPLQTALILALDKLPTQKQQEERVLAGKKPLEGKLTVETVLRDWNLDADLVVLSACETGLGQMTNREGMLGFTQALLQKGARSVLLTRWEVDDAATSLLMRRFYQNVMGKRDGLKKPMPRAEALKEAKTWLRNLTTAQAQKELSVMLDGVPRGERGKIVAAKKGRVPATKPMDKKDRPFDHPYYWAAFILVGDPE